jgi:hypothetical protein
VCRWRCCWSSISPKFKLQHYWNEDLNNLIRAGVHLNGRALVLCGMNVRQMGNVGDMILILCFSFSDISSYYNDCYILIILAVLIYSETCTFLLTFIKT